MDLCEISINKKRHPWERVRVRSLRMILKTMISFEHNLRVLDVGCGDAFILFNLFKGFTAEVIEGVDINLSEDQIIKLSNQGCIIKFHRRYDSLKERFYNLILLLDVIEHVKEDRTFLYEIIDRYLDERGVLLITVPAFRFLFSSHDMFLKHHRRYNLKALHSLFAETNIECLFSGFLFSSLIPIRLMLLCYERYFNVKNRFNKGVGNWNYGSIPTRVIELVLTIENNFLIILARMGIKLPGLTIWAICKKQQ